VLNTAKSLERQGFKVDYLNVDNEGFVDLEQLGSLITKETALVSIQHANQEIGTLQDIKSIADICSEKDVLLHTDATHTFTRVPLDVQKLPVDLMSMSAHTYMVLEIWLCICVKALSGKNGWMAATRNQS
jgi:cysteine desulfurase